MVVNVNVNLLIFDIFKTDVNGQISMIDSVILKNIVRVSTARPPLEIL